MGIKGALIKVYGKTHTRGEVLDYALKILGLDDGEFREEQHPRDEKGRFASGGSTSIENKDDLIAMVAGKNNYLGKPEFQVKSTAYKTALKRAEKLSKEFSDLGDKLKKELIVDPDYGPELSAFFGKYTEKGKKIKQKYDETSKELESAKADRDRYEKELDSIKKAERKREKAARQKTSLTFARQQDYEGFSFKSDVPYMQEKIENGSAIICEMSPQDYLERCAYDIFDTATLSSCVAAASVENVKKYAKMMQNGTKFSIPYLNYSSRDQEGRHRALAAMLCGIKKIPVAVVGTPNTYTQDEEIWRTTEEGKHFKLENQTGEIKAGFGGKLNGKKLGGSWGKGKNAGMPKKPTTSTGEGYQVPAPERNPVKKSEKVPVSFTKYSDGSERRKEHQEKFMKNFESAKKNAEEAFSKKDADIDTLENAVYKLHEVASESDAAHEAREGIGGADKYGLGKMPKEWDARLTPTEQEVLENIAREYESLDYGQVAQWSKENEDADRVMHALQAKFLGAEIDSKIPDNVLEKYSSTEIRQEVPGQMSMFWGENVEGENRNPELSESTKVAEPAKTGPYYDELERRRNIAHEWDDMRQAHFLLTKGFASEEELLDAVDQGTVAEKLDDYFDALASNGDPTPTKPLRKQVNLYGEIEEGKHGGDWTQARLDYIKDWTGMSDEEAKQTHAEFEKWFGGSWFSADTKAVDDYIDRDGAYSGEIFRGMHFTEDEYAKFMQGIEVGSKFGMRGHNSSWTNDREVAWGFSRNGDRHVIIHCMKNKSSAPVSHLSSKGEDEVIAHSRTKWTVIGVVEGNNRTEIKVLESDERMSDEEWERGRMETDAAPVKEKDNSSFNERMNAQNKFFVVFPKEQSVEDGGPGSGNWGHRGRPGKRGGSGKGGGSQYRGGKAGIAFVGSRKDWMNGLTGENQQKAAKFMSNMKRKLDEDVQFAKYILAEKEKGSMSQKEIDNWMKKSHFDQLSDNPTPEEYIMKTGSMEEKEEFLNHVQGGRGWMEHADRLIEENWDEKDRKLANALANKYGLLNIDGTEVPDDRNTQNWDKDDLACWYDLKAKAMEIPTSGQEAPRQLQYSAGVMEKPPKPVWANNITDDEIHNMAQALSIAGGVYLTKEQLLDSEVANEVEKSAFERAYTSYMYQSRLKVYIKDKVLALCGEEENVADFILNTDVFNNLESEEYEQLLEIAHYAKNRRENYFESLDYLDQGERMKQLAILNAALGGKDMNEFVDQKNEELKKKREEERAKKLAELKKIEEEREKKRQEAKKKAEEEKAKRAPAIAAAKKSLQNDGLIEKINKASTADEVAEAISGVGMFANDGKANFSKMNVSLAKACAEKYSSVMQRYPFLIGVLQAPECERLGARTYANCFMQNGKVNLSTKWFGSDADEFAKSYESDVRSNFHPQGTDYASIVVHELGHAMEGRLTDFLNREKGKYFTLARTGSLAESLREKVFKAMGLGKYKKATATKHVSEYASKNAQEWFAECFAEAFCSSDPRPMAQEFARQLHKLIEDNGLEGDLNA